MVSRNSLSFAFIALALFLTGSQAFSPRVAVGYKTVAAPSSTTGLYMSSPPANDFENSLGSTERLLMEKANARKQGLVQEYGRTVKKDGLDEVRAVVWGVFHASQAVFSVLAVALVIGMALNAAGYGYYLDNTGVHIDTFQHMHQMQFLEAETTRLAVAAEQNAWMR